MKVFQELKILGGRNAIQRWLELVTSAATHNWQRDVAREGELPDYVCFARQASAELPETKLYLIEQAYGLEVANVVPIGRNLNINQYNTVIREFGEQLATPAAQEAGVDVRLSSDTFGLEQAFPPAVLDKLFTFSNNANKSTGAGHPLDRGRWLDFVVAAFRENVRVDEGTLARLLDEELDWPEDVATELARDYGAALEVLRFNSRDPQPEQVGAA